MDRQTDGENCDGQDALKAAAAFVRKKLYFAGFVFPR